MVEGKLEQERKLFEVQMKTLLTDYDKLMKDNQSKQSIVFGLFEKKTFYSELLTRYNQTKTMLNEYEKKSQISSKPLPNNEFPNPQRVRFYFD